MTAKTGKPRFFDEDHPEHDIDAITLAGAVAIVESHFREWADAFAGWDCETQSYRSHTMTTVIYQRCTCVWQPAAWGGIVDIDEPDCDMCDNQGYLDDLARCESASYTALPDRPVIAEGPVTHVLVRTSFHNGGVISEHTSERDAQWALWDHAGESECGCGCAVVVPIAEMGDLKEAIDTPGYNSPAL